MITIVRSDGNGLVISSARSLMKTKGGLIVDFGDEHYIVENCNLSTIAEMTAGRFVNMIIINKEWKGLPKP